MLNVTESLYSLDTGPKRVLWTRTMRPVNAASLRSENQAANANITGSGNIDLIIENWQEHYLRSVKCKTLIPFCVARSGNTLASIAKFRFAIPKGGAAESIAQSGRLFVKSIVVVDKYVYDFMGQQKGHIHYEQAPEYFKLGKDGVALAPDCHQMDAAYEQYSRCELESIVSLALSLVFNKSVFNNPTFFQGPGGDYTREGFVDHGETTESDSRSGIVETFEQDGTPVGIEADDLETVPGYKAKYEYSMNPIHCDYMGVRFTGDRPPPDAGGGIPTPPDSGDGGTPTPPDEPPVGPPPPPPPWPRRPRRGGRAPDNGHGVPEEPDDGFLG